MPGVLFQPSVTVVFARGFERERQTEIERQIIIDASHDAVPFSVTVGPSPKGGQGPARPPPKSATDSGAFEDC